MAAVAGSEAPLAPSPAPCAGACEQAAEEGLLVQPPELAFGVESDDGASSSGAAEVPSALGWGRLRRPRALAVGALGAALLLSCVAAGVGLQRRASGPEAASVDDEVELGALDSMFGVMGTMADSVHEAATLSDNIEQGYNSMRDVADTFNNSTQKFAGIGGKLIHQLKEGPEKRKALLAKFRALNATQKAKVRARLFKRFNITSWKQLRHKVGLHDNNTCLSDEEENANLCYKKCAILTEGHFPFRVSAWECCAHPGPCTEAYKIDFRICGGFGTSGDQVGGGCPHTPGGCLKSEEIYGNFCYKRCDFLTYGVLSDRAGPATCCKAGHATSMFAFLDGDVCDTQSKYYVGGGEGDDDHRTPSDPHPPMMRFTEATD